MSKQTLQPNAKLQGGRYRILSILGQGGFGITYLAEQTMLGCKVAIKEFFMKEFCNRDECTSHVTIGTEGSRETVNRFRVKFLKEARNIANLKHPNIVRIIDVFDENDTAYYVMDYIGGCSLSSKVKRYGALPEAEATNYILQVADALDYIHRRNMNHLDVKPANIVLSDENGAAILIDFVLSKQYDATGEQTSSTPVGVSEGYAPLEQYRPGGVGTFSPQTDIYSLGATFFYLLTGKTPPSATDVNEDGIPVEQLRSKGVSQNVIDVICNSMKSSRKQRLQDIRSFKEELKGFGIGGNTRGEGTNEHVENEDTVIIDKKPKTFKSGRNTNKETFTVNDVPFTMVRVEGGTFQMGATSEQGYDAYKDEKPPHQVTLSTYFIGETEVTQELWVAVMGSNPSYYKGAKRPVECVNWKDCQQFVKKLNSATGRIFRLPTEAEWEFAARGGRLSRGYKYSGSDNIEAVAWCVGNGGNISHDVAMKQANELGLYDMSGNVWEWCNDWYDEYNNEPQTNPSGPDNRLVQMKDSRVYRGGSWNSYERFCRVSYRNITASGHRIYNLGLRLALSADCLARDEGDFRIYNVNGVEFQMQKVESGTFTMGVEYRFLGGIGADDKAHTVTLTNNYYIGQTQVTQELWQAVMGDNPSHFKGDRLPVESVSWEDSQRFIEKLNNLTNKHFRLPTEAEWEFACRGGTCSRGYRYSGSNTIDDVAWHEGNSGNSTHEVGLKRPNELEIFDMSGNVLEMCSDWYDKYSSGTQINPKGASEGLCRVFRGGSWSNNANICRSLARNYFKPFTKFNYLGLRIALSE